MGCIRARQTNRERPNAEATHFFSDGLPIPGEVAEFAVLDKQVAIGTFTQQPILVVFVERDLINKNRCSRQSTHLSPRWGGRSGFVSSSGAARPPLPAAFWEPPAGAAQHRKGMASTAGLAAAAEVVDKGAAGAAGVAAAARVAEQVAPGGARGRRGGSGSRRSGAGCGSPQRSGRRREPLPRLAPAGRSQRRAGNRPFLRSLLSAGWPRRAVHVRPPRPGPPPSSQKRQPSHRRL